jgi:hypothetical protein
MHRTLSVDFIVVTNGHLRCQLDNGETIDLYPGDQVVQRATMHKWSNPSKCSCFGWVGLEGCELEADSVDQVKANQRDLWRLLCRRRSLVRVGRG